MHTPTDTDAAERALLEAVLLDLRTRFGDDALQKLLRAAWLQDMAYDHAEAMADGETCVDFDPRDLDFDDDLRFWMEGMAENVWDVHTQAL